MTISEILRYLAEMADLGYEAQSCGATSPYICDNLNYPDRHDHPFTHDEGRGAADYLRALGMPDGFGVFRLAGDDDLRAWDLFPFEQTQRRIDWLLFAADLYEAEEAGGTLCLLFTNH